MKYLRVFVLFLVVSAMLSLPLVQCNGSSTAALWLFDEGMGTTAYDASSNGNNGTIYGATYVAGKFNYALEFDGSDDYVEVPDSSSLNLTDEVTIEAWVNWKGTGLGWQAIVAKGFYQKDVSNESYALYIHRDKKRFHFVLTVTGTRHVIRSPLNSTPVGTWFHVMATYNGSYVKIYRNAHLIKTASLTGSLTTNDSPLRIARARTNYFNGTLDKVRIGNKAAVPLEADVNGDGKVDIQDIALVALAFGSYGPDLYDTQAHPRWNEACDLYPEDGGDGKVDIRDIVIVARAYGNVS